LSCVRGLRALGIALVVATFAPDAYAWCHTTTVPAQPDPLVCPARGVPLAWPFGCAALRIDPTTPVPRLGPGVLRQVTLDAMATWSSAACTHTAGRDASGGPSFRLVLLDDRVVPVGYLPDGPNTNTLAAQARWSDDPFHPPDAAAVTVTTFHPLTGAILDADTELNVEGFRFAVDDRTASDLPTILSHEFGHTQGLAHSAERRAVMWYSAGIGEQRRQLSADDAEGICTIYPPDRFAPCVPELQRGGLEGGGVACAVSPQPGRTAPRATELLPWVLGLAWVLRRRAATARR